MEFKEYVKQRNRMIGCEDLTDLRCFGVDCLTCYKFTNDRCLKLVEETSTKEAEQIVQKWAEEHPIMTNGMKFQEVFGENTPVLAPPSWLYDEYKEQKEVEE